MAVRLSRKLFAQRRIQVGYGVVFLFKPFGYSQYKEAEARAQRLAREQLDRIHAVTLDSVDDEEVGPEVRERLVGLASEIHLDILVTSFCEGWEGVYDEPDEVASGKGEEIGDPLPFTPKTWERFREELPLIADVLDRKLAEPSAHVVQEGKGSAPLPNGAIPAA